MKKTIFTKFLLLINIIPLFSLKIYNYNDIKVDFDLELEGGYYYEAEMFPGLSSFQIDTSDISLTAEFDDNIVLDITYDSTLKNANLKYTYFDELRINAGLFKVHYGGERVAGYSPHPENSLATDNFTPGHSIGLSLYGKNVLDFFNYNFSFTNDYNSDIDSDNETGHHTLTLLLNKTFDLDDKYILTTGYNVLFNTNEIFSEGIYMELYNEKERGLYILAEYMEQRYFNYYWNCSIFLSTAYRFDTLEPFIHVEFYNDYIGEETEDDAFVTGIGVNRYTQDDRLKITFSYINSYAYSETNTFEIDYISKMEHKLSLRCGFSI